VFRKALNVTRGVGLPICFHASEAGLLVHSQNAEVAVEYHQAGEFSPESLTLPLEFLKDCAGGGDDPVELGSSGENLVEVKWIDRKIPRVVQYDSPAPLTEFPQRPSVTVHQDPRMLCALKAASETCDPDSLRYALGCLELCGETGEIAATDTRQLLVQRGFPFPWNGKMLIPRNAVWSSPELAEVSPISIGQTKDAVMVTVGPWSIWLQIAKDGRFPNVRDHIPSKDSAIATLDLAEADAEFLTDGLKGLPSSDAKAQPVTLDLTGEIIIRAKADDGYPTDLVLSNSKLQGANLRINTNRQFLARAIGLGFRQIHFTGCESPAFCQDDCHSFVWALLEKDGVIPPDGKALRVESPVVKSARTSKSSREEKRPFMAKNHKPEMPPVQNGQKPTELGECKTLEALLEHAVGLQETLRDAATRLRELMTLLKQHQKESKSVQTVLASLRRLPSLNA
jgi:hypothetical protein